MPGRKFREKGDSYRKKVAYRNCDGLERLWDAVCDERKMEWKKVWRKDTTKKWMKEANDASWHDRPFEWMNEGRKEGRNEWTNEWMNERMNERTNERMNEWTNERMNEWMDGWMHGMKEWNEGMEWRNGMKEWNEGMEWMNGMNEWNEWMEWME